MARFLLVQQSVCIKYACCLCFWDSRDKCGHGTRKDWPSKEYMLVGGQNVVREA